MTPTIIILVYINIYIFKNKHYLSSIWSMDGAPYRHYCLRSEQTLQQLPRASKLEPHHHHSSFYSFTYLMIFSECTDKTDFKTINQFLLWLLEANSTEPSSECMVSAGNKCSNWPTTFWRVMIHIYTNHHQITLGGKKKRKKKRSVMILWWLSLNIDDNH